MQERKQWKTITMYVTGVLLLVCVIVLAWFMPEWYAQLQDEQQIGQVRLSSREDIRFLDGTSLDMAGRMKLLKESKVKDWLDYSMLSINTTAKLTEAREGVTLWIENGLLPEWVSSLVQADYLMEAATYGVLLDGDTVLPLCLFRFEYFDDGYDSDETVTIVMDAEKDIMYYACFCGERAREYIAHSAGYETLEQLEKEVDELLADGQTETAQEMLELIQKSGDSKLREESSGYDFAEVCGAETAQVTELEPWLLLDVDLKFETFTGYAGRRMMMREDGEPGVAISFGSDVNDWYVELMLAEYFGDGYLADEYIYDMNAEWNSSYEDELSSVMIEEYNAG